MKQKMELELTQKLTASVDMIDLQSFALSAEATAGKLVKKHNGNFHKIEKEVRNFIGGENKEFTEEVLWAARWMSKVF